MVLSNTFGDSDSTGPWAYVFPSARSHAMKPTLRLHSDEPENIPATLRFVPTLPGRAESSQGRSSSEMAMGVEHAIEDAQRKLDDLRKLLFPVRDDEGPSAA